MNIDKRWLLLLTLVASAGGAALALKVRQRQHHRVARNRDYRTELKSWENEGGNLAPAPAAAATP